MLILREDGGTKEHRSIFIRNRGQLEATACFCDAVPAREGEQENYHYQIMALSKGKPRDRRGEKRRIPERGIRPRVGQTRRKRANTPRRRQPYDSVNLPQLVYELLTIDKYNQGKRDYWRTTNCSAALDRKIDSVIGNLFKVLNVLTEYGSFKLMYSSNLVIFFSILCVIRHAIILLIVLLL